MRRPTPVVVVPSTLGYVGPAVGDRRSLRVGPNKPFVGRVCSHPSDPFRFESPGRRLRPYPSGRKGTV